MKRAISYNCPNKGLLSVTLSLGLGTLALGCMPKQQQPAAQDYRPQMQQSLDGNKRWFASYKPTIDSQMAKLVANETLVAPKATQDAQYPIIKKQGDSIKESWQEVQARQAELEEWGDSMANPVHDDLAAFARKSTSIQQEAAQISTGLGRLEIEYLSLRGRLGMN